MSICVQDVMARGVVTVDSSQSAKNAARLMTKFGISALVVLTDGELVGILTERDIITRVVASGNDSDSVTIKEIMTEPVVVVNPEMPIENAAKIMLHEKIKKLPVVVKEDAGLRLVGMLSITDIARLHPQLWENIKKMAEISNGIAETEANFYIR